MKQWLFIYLCTFVYISNEVNAKFCERTETVTSLVEITFSTSYIRTHRGECDDCIIAQWATSVSGKYVPKREMKTIKYCCSGYIRTDDSSSDSDIVCEPICMPACKNGHCKAPGECACDTGYILDPKDSHNCLPLCGKGCDHGACVAPDTCQCDFGYKPMNTTCQPVCTDPCENGTCVAPETCECLPGYRKSEKNLCEPYCSSGCGNGSCRAPETCSCNSGWLLKKGKYGSDTRCEPFCSMPCDNGICEAPETCVCNEPRYKKSKSGICEPVCTPTCGNGTCTHPDTCSCFPGYHKDPLRKKLYLFLGPNTTVCIPTCTDCEDEFCVAPNKCKKRGSSWVPEVPEPQAYDTFYDEYNYDDYNISVTDPKFMKPTNNNLTNKNLVTTTTHSYVTNKVTETIKSPNDTSSHSNGTTASVKSMSWYQQHWVSIFIPLLVIVTAAIIMIVVWRRAPIVIFFKGRSYVVDGDPVDNGSRPFEDIQISAIHKKN